MESRKIQLVGYRSYAISLPKEWIIHNKLKEKDNVYIDTTKNNELVIRPSSREHVKKETLTIDIDSIDNISEFIVFGYSKGVQLRLISKKLSFNQIKSVREILKNLDGYEITTENDKLIEISFLFQNIDINLDKIIFRIVYLLKLMITSLENKDFSTLEETETSIDKLYHLGTKILFESLGNQKVRLENNILHQEDILYIKDIIKKLENIGDSIFMFKSIKLSNHDKNKLKEAVDYCDKILIKKETNQVFIQKIENTTHDKELNYLINRIQHLCRDIHESVLSIEFNKKYFS